jgi:hypothetical protein
VGYIQDEVMGDPLEATAELVAADQLDTHGCYRPVNDLEASVGVLDQRGEAFHPVAVVAVQHTVDHAHFGVVDVAAHHALHAARRASRATAFSKSPT